MVIPNCIIKEVSKMQYTNILITILCSFYLVKCEGISVGGAKCREKQCKISEYCSSFDSTCQPCEIICDAKSHNYEEDICEKDCQSKFFLNYRSIIRIENN